MMTKIGKRFRKLPSPAMMVACLALTIALSGVGYAAVAIPRNSVGTVQLKKNAVNSAKVKDRSLRSVDFAAGQIPAGPKGDAGAQGPQGLQGPPGAPNPNAANSDKLDGKDSAEFAPAAAEPVRLVGATGQPAFQTGGEEDCIWSNFDGNHSAAGFFKDPWGVVHVKGLVDADHSPYGLGSLECDFPGRDPYDTPGGPYGGPDHVIFFLPDGYRPARRLVFMTIAAEALMRVNIDPDGGVSIEQSHANAENVLAWVSLEGITFRAGA